ncbi:chemotaxis protein CheB [Frateuria defendens]|uniref:chemotaxis protein CheB n=1 Tax=Frateuria defendens TaxID=2219559 RepID=UPI00066FEC10|nr:chemotaxis protein CheB [Frateuria defendens]
MNAPAATVPAAIVPAAIVVGCSTGGLDALRTLLGGLDPRLPQAVVVCSHTAAETAELLCGLLTHVAPLPVAEAAERQSVRGGVIHVAPSGYHLLVERDGRFALSVDPRVQHARPSIDVLFESAAETWGAALVGVILTGANADGAEGLRAVRRAGGVAVVQAPEDAQAAAMPLAALDLAGADHCLPLPAIAPLLNRLCLP